MTAAALFNYFLLGCLALFAVLLIIMVIRSIMGPGTSNRIIAINMLGTMVICAIAILGVYLDQDYLVDVCLIYAMISFLAVVVVTKIMGGVILEKRHITDETKAVEENLAHQHPEKKGGDDNGLL